MFDHRRLVLNFNDRLLVVRLYLNVRLTTYRIPPQVKLFQRLPRNCDSLLSDVLVAEPLSCVVALVLVATDEVKALLEGGPALCAFLFMLRRGLHFGLQSEWKHFELVFVLVLKQCLWRLLGPFCLVPLRHDLYSRLYLISPSHLLVCLIMHVLSLVVFWNETYELI